MNKRVKKVYIRSEFERRPVATRSRRFRLTIDEDEALKRNAKAAGYENVSGYIRFSSLKRTPDLAGKIVTLTDTVNRTFDLILIVAKRLPLNPPIQNVQLERNSKPSH